MLGFVAVSCDQVRTIGRAIDGDFALASAADSADVFAHRRAEAFWRAPFANWTAHSEASVVCRKKNQTTARDDSAPIGFCNAQFFASSTSLAYSGPMSRIRRCGVILCLAVVLLAALMHAGIALPVSILAPLWFFFATVVSVPIPRVDEQWYPQPFPDEPVFSPRPPPSR